MLTREDVILPLVRGKKVLDCGGVNHEVFAEMQAAGTWLHAKIAAEAAECIGLDIRDAHVKTINEQGKYRFVAGNAEHLEFDEEFDVVTAGEFIEHLYNPGQFLDGVWRALRPDGVLILTTPNAMAATMFAQAFFRNRERGHPEHTMLFSPDTLRYLLERHGFRVETMQTVDREARRPLIGEARALLRRARPLLGEVLVAVARKSEPADHWESLPGRA